jgi:hypothetical protein
MFVRADRLLTEVDNGRFPKHAISFHWEGFVPHLVAYDTVDERIVEIDLSKLDMTVSEERTCVGRFEEEYHPCPQQKTVRGSFDQCNSCAESWIPRQECVFEPQCEGDRCDCHFCKRPHLVYAAFYGKKTKIGMTSGSRMAERAIEQGADAIVALVDCENRFRAREMEKDISKFLVLPQRMTRADIVKQLASNTTKSELEERYSKILESLRDRYYLRGDELTMLDEYPMHLKLEEVPAETEAHGTHRGKVRGKKGRYLFFEDEDDGAVKMLDLSDLPSRHLQDRGK